MPNGASDTGTAVGVGALLLGALRIVTPLIERLIDVRERQLERDERRLTERLQRAEARLADVEALAVVLTIERGEAVAERDRLAGEVGRLSARLAEREGP